MRPPQRFNLARRAMREGQPPSARSCRVFMMKDTTSSVDSVPLTICVAEDRRDCETGLKLLLISINRLCLDIAVIIFYPEATQNFIDWLQNLDLQHRFELRARSGLLVHMAGMLSRTRCYKL